MLSEYVQSNKDIIYILLSLESHSFKAYANNVLNNLLDFWGDCEIPRHYQSDFLFHFVSTTKSISYLCVKVWNKLI